ncbi:hypothetical protein NCCP2331_09300 [Sporosarcina sp. NCCP-2331]|nr:hypothetical protein NCCP2331_09300 [Sporosarcina sp. NCCP-2331]GLB54887.1 hypothetical protein NCCP2378_06720 [Sporosarcina sp. NCCP-2378]
MQYVISRKDLDSYDQCVYKVEKRKPYQLNSYSAKNNMIYFLHTSEGATAGSAVAKRTAKGSLCRISAFFAEIKAMMHALRQ